MGGLLDDAVAVVTGGASGMGRVVVLRFLAEGARVVFGDLDDENAKRVLDDVPDASRAHFVRTDVAVEDDVVTLFDAAAERFGELDVMFNGAGVGGAFGPLTEIDAGDWGRTFAVLYCGVFLQEARGDRSRAREARAREGGRT